MHKFVKICFILTVCLCLEVFASKRVLLHSDDSLAVIVQDLQAKFLDQEKRLASQEQEIMALKGQVISNTASGSTYVRWGRTSCPANGTNLLYKGFMAGQHYGRKGGAADAICLTQEPTWGEYNDNENTNGAQIFGTEYEFTDPQGPLYSMGLYKHDVPCAVCHSHHSATLMIPGRDQCYPGWTLAYSGYLVSGRQQATFDPSSTNYVCLDKQPETEFGDRNIEGGRLVVPVEAQCGSLKCPPYVQFRELTCVVCLL